MTARRTRSTLGGRLLWFVGLWGAGVLAVGALAYGLRAILIG